MLMSFVGSEMYIIDSFDSMQVFGAQLKQESSTKWSLRFQYDSIIAILLTKSTFCLLLSINRVKVSCYPFTKTGYLARG
ncbi:hypothetical protein AMQ83_36045 [Paenibacillus riograndensis]|nr:hypothetical protein AMQ83_36045 [Paenibacillus riograndensis]